MNATELITLLEHYKITVNPAITLGLLFIIVIIGYVLVRFITPTNYIAFNKEAFAQQQSVINNLREDFKRVSETSDKLEAKVKELNSIIADLQEQLEVCRNIIRGKEHGTTKEG